jgi:drug/metabolite transporter (DMT)-like permease
VLVIVRPGPDGMNLYALVALAAAVLVAGRDLATRFVPADVPSTVVALASTASVGLAGLIAGFGEAWPPLGRLEMAYIIGAGILTLGNLANIMASATPTCPSSRRSATASSCGRFCPGS